ncbi:MAG: 2-amino-4-hydroxy-6-hydroxymethyldihydropteridine diphosphokinase [Pseudohongiellaceae bacterium]
MQASHFCVVALGANLPSLAGTPAETLSRAILDLTALAPSSSPPPPTTDNATTAQISSLYTSDPVDCPPHTPEFVNAIIALPLLPNLNAHQFLQQLLTLETSYGRQREPHSRSRCLDLDLIAYGEASLHTPDLTLPHPEAHRRRFVLAPLAEILPDYRLPGQSATARQLLARLPQSPAVRRLKKPATSLTQ